MEPRLLLTALTKSKTHLIKPTDVQLSWDKVHHRLTKSLMDVIKVASSRRRNVILDQVKSINSTVKYRVHGIVVCMVWVANS
jgi:hypothetical protein